MIERIIFIFLMCMAIRTIKTMQKINEISGHKLITAVLIGMDTTVFLLVFKNLLTGELVVPVILAMAFGYISGYYLGAFIEEKMALGKVKVTIKIAKEQSKKVITPIE